MATCSSTFADITTYELEKVTRFHAADVCLDIPANLLEPLSNTMSQAMCYNLLQTVCKKPYVTTCRKLYVKALCYNLLQPITSLYVTTCYNLLQPVTTYPNRRVLNRSSLRYTSLACLLFGDTL